MRRQMPDQWTEWGAFMSTASLIRAVDDSTEGLAETDLYARRYCEHADAVYNYCLWRVRDPIQAEDLTADVFVRAWRARKRYDPRRAQFATWLMTIARRTVIDRLRRNARHQAVPLPEDLASPQPGPEALVERDAETARLLALVNRLPAADQDLLALKFGAGLTNREIALTLSKSESAIGSWLHRTIQRLRKEWEPK